MSLYSFLRSIVKDDEYDRLTASALSFNQQLVQLQQKEPAFAQLQKDYALLQRVSDTDKQVINEKAQLVEDLQAKILELEYPHLTPELERIMNFYESKYPKKDIFYSGRFLGANVGINVPLDVKVFASVGVNDFQLKTFVKTIGADVESLKKKYPNKTLHEIYTEAIRLILVNTPVNYIQDADNQNYKDAEFWAFSFETNRLGSGDCDDWSIYRHVLFVIAGVPEQLLRIVAGNSSLGGHCTNYFYNPVTNSFANINSTTTFSDVSFEEMLKHGDNVSLAISSPWFSFNSLYSFQRLDTESSAQFKDQDLFKTASFLDKVKKKLNIG